MSWSRSNGNTMVDKDPILVMALFGRTVFVRYADDLKGAIDRIRVHQLYTSYSMLNNTVTFFCRSLIHSLTVFGQRNDCYEVDIYISLDDNQSERLWGAVAVCVCMCV